MALLLLAIGVAAIASMQFDVGPFGWEAIGLEIEPLKRERRSRF